MALKVTDLAQSDVVLGDTRTKLWDLVRNGHIPRSESDAFAVERGHYETRNGKQYPARPKYWNTTASVLEACHRWGVEPVLSIGGTKRVKKAGGLNYGVALPPKPAPVVAPAPSSYPAPHPAPKVITNAADPAVPNGTPVPATPAPTPTPVATVATAATNAEKLAALKALVTEIVEEARGRDEIALRDLIAGVSTAAAGAAVEVTGQQLLATLEANNAARIAEALAKLEEARPVVIHVKTNDRPAVVIKGKTHRAFKVVYQLAVARRNIALIGPTGCGKTHICAQVADALFGEGASLNGKYATISCTAGMSESKLVGGLLPIGEGGRFEAFISDFVRLFRDGGLFLLDEWDAADSNVALIVNQALANGHVDLPLVGRINRHKDFICVAALNTYGTGANHMFVGRNKLDEATLDRFRIGQVEMDYDRKLEQDLVAAFDNDKLLTPWLTRCWGVRDKIDNLNRGGLASFRKSMSTRFILDGCVMLLAGWTLEQTMSQLVRGWSVDECNKVGITPIALY